jgi:hypothetical protein
MMPADPNNANGHSRRDRMERSQVRFEENQRALKERHREFQQEYGRFLKSLVRLTGRLQDPDTQGS